VKAKEKSPGKKEYLNDTKFLSDTSRASLYGKFRETSIAGERKCPMK
jgi:hypothetical protein